jgi:hypothetical protein
MGLGSEYNVIISVISTRQSPLSFGERKTLLLLEEVKLKK